MYRSLALRLQAVIGLVCFQCGGGEGIILPPCDQGGHGRDPRRDQLLHGGALDGQHGLAQSAEHLIGQRQQQAGRAPRCPQSAPFPAKDIVYTVASLQELCGLLQALYAEKFGKDILTDRCT